MGQLNQLRSIRVLGTGFCHYLTGMNPAFEFINSWQKMLQVVTNRMGGGLCEYLANRQSMQPVHMFFDWISADIYDEYESLLSAE